MGVRMDGSWPGLEEVGRSRRPRVYMGSGVKVRIVGSGGWGIGGSLLDTEGVDGSDCCGGFWYAACSRL